MDEIDSEQKIEEMLESDTPPQEPLGDTTDYRQVVAAWSKAHGLGFEEMVQTLENTGGPDALRLVDEIKRDPGTEEAFRRGLDEPISGDIPNEIGDEIEVQRRVGPTPAEMPRS